MIVDPSKIHRARTKIMEKERDEAIEKLMDEKLQSIFLWKERYDQNDSGG